MEALQELEFQSDWYNNLVEFSSEKKALINQFKSFLEINNCSHVLEVGMGTFPVFSSQLAHSVDTYSIVERDPFQGNFPENTKFIHGDFENLELNSKFDAIILSHVIYYFKNLDKAIKKTLECLTKKGSAYFVVNGTGKNYGPLKHAFSKITGIPFEFTYDKLARALDSHKYIEHSIEVSIRFENYEELYSSIKLFFDLYPIEFEEHKDEIIDWLKSNIKGNQFFMDQQIFEVVK